MKEAEVLGLLREVGAIMEGHFELSSGRHSGTYVEKFRALERPDVARRLGEALAERFRDRPVDVVLAPAVGGVVVGFVTALALGARFVFGEREEGSMRLRRGFEIKPGERVLVVEDVVTTGGSLREVLELVAPGELTGVGCLVDRWGGARLALPLQSLARLDADSWDPSDCPLCAGGRPVTAPGSRHLTC